jgi:UDP-N-acetylglucosamine 2-epimerase (non-hydrolysing)
VAAAAGIGLTLETGAIELMSPQPYVETMRLVRGAAGVVTDSGGLQKEAFLRGTPCLTVRAETEWLETLVDGWNILDPTAAGVVRQAIRPRPMQAPSMPFGDGHAAEKVVAALGQ